MKKLRILIMCLLLVSLLAGCSKVNNAGGNGTATPSASSSESGEAKDSIIIALQGEPTTLDPQYPDDSNMFWVTWQVFEPLVKFDGQTLEIVPVLAESYQNVDDTTWEFTIKQGVKFHDGSDFTVDDAVYSVNRIIDPDYGSQIASDFDTIDHAEAVDASTFKIITKKPDPILLKRLTKLSMLSKSYSEGKTHEELSVVANGTGPFKLDNWNRGSQIDISAFDGYWGDKPSIKKATYRFIEEASTRVSALKSGEIDLAMNMLPEYVDDLPQVFTSAGFECYFMRFNQLSGIMQNKDLRLAMNYAIDKEAIADDLFLGYATPEKGQIDREGNTGFTSSLSPYPYDVEKAKELIASSGYNGEKIELISEKSRWIKDGEVTETVAAMLQEVGLNVEVKFLSWNEWLDTLFDKTKAPDLMFSSTSSEFMDADRTYSNSIHSDGTQSAMSNPEYDKLIEEARYEMDPEKRQSIYDQLNTALYNDPPKLLLVNVNELHGGSADLQWTMRKDCRIYLSELSFK